MRIICDNCGAQYKIPIEKLGKRVNRATCRRCGSHILIHHEQNDAKKEIEDALVNHDDERTLINDEAKPPVKSEPEAEQPKPIGDGVQLMRQSGGLDLPQDLPSGPDDVDDRTISSKPDPVVDTQAALAKLAPQIRQSTPESEKAKPEKAPTSSSSKQVVPNSDMYLIVGASFLAMIGLASAAYGANASNQLLAMIGLGLGFAGLLSNVLVAMTSNFGATSASKGVSIGLSTVVGLIVCAAVFVTGFAASETSSTTVADAQPSLDKPELLKNTEAPEANAEDEDTDGDEEEADEAAVEAEAVAEAAEDDEAVAPVPTPIPTPPPVASNTTEALPEPAPAPSPAPTPAPEPEPEAAPITPEPSAPAPATQIPDTVVHTVLSSNAKVKRCFQAEYKQTGTPPNNVPVQFMVAPDGNILTAYITTGPYKGSSFETCLADAIKSVTMPPFTGSPQQVSYTFRLG